jgi:hypothetical protein
MTVRVYRSSDGSAPTLTGATGSLVALLDAILVNGYGAQAAAGWTIAYTATNKRAYQQNTTGSNLPTGAFLYVDDAGPGAGGAREARACGFETMSAITPVGTGQFPTSSQSSIGFGALVIRKSTTADSTARAWTCIANGQTIYLFIETGDYINPVMALPFVFGDFFSYRSGDHYAICIVGRTAENTNSPVNEPFQAFYAITSAYLANTIIGHYVARSWTGVGGSTMIGKHVDQVKMGASTAGSGVSSGVSLASNINNTLLGSAPNFSSGFPYPNGPDGACWVSPIWIHHNSSVRGYFKGLWAPLHDRPLNHDDTYSVSGGNLNGKSMIVQSLLGYTNGAVPAQVHIETSDTWS